MGLGRSSSLTLRCSLTQWGSGPTVRSLTHRINRRSTGSKENIMSRHSLTRYSPTRHRVTWEIRESLIRWNSLTRSGRRRNRVASSLALSGRGISPVIWDVFVAEHPVTAYAYGLTRRPLLSAGFTGWVAGLK
ncbi:hypothetical protein SEA_PUREGLOBE5_125 [Arthrobacter phage Pureglobe5]|nr:hypothetical protein SEA_PUREGLOBE5_125 [Arthrobacter phage Pureglobe5]